MASPVQSAEENVLCVLQLCRANVQTYCFGLAASMGAFLLTAGTKGKRYSMPNARIMIHQPLGGASGQVGPGFTQHSCKQLQALCDLMGLHSAWCSHACCSCFDPADALAKLV